MAELLRRWALTVLVNASSPVAVGSQRNAQAALQSRYDSGRHGAEVLAALRASSGSSAAAGQVARRSSA